MAKTGSIIVLDGIDGSGKTTQAKLLHDELSLRGEKVRLFQHPGGTALGSELRKLVKSPLYKPNPYTERMLFAADCSQMLTEIISPAIANGETLIFDRFYLFTDVVYGRANGMSLTWLKHMTEMLPFIPKADLLMVFQINPDVAAERKLSRKLTEPASGFDGQERCRIEQNGANFLRMVGSYYNGIQRCTSAGQKHDVWFDLQSAFHTNARRIIPIDANQPPLDVKAAVFKEYSEWKEINQSLS